MLNKIVADKRKEVEQTRQNMPVSILMERIAQRKPLDFARAIRGDGIRLIAEIKKASPSRGVLCPDFNPVAIARSYAQGGAAAISVLTEINYFQGSIDHLAAIRKEVEIPLLRKDFVFDQYQIYESAAFGADALLLIAGILSQEQLSEFLSLSHSFGLSCLVEVHDEGEVEKALLGGAEIIGINNRDLRDFTIDINTTRRLRPLIPPERTVVSESGIKSRSDIEKLQEWGADAALVGEVLVTADDTTAKMRELSL